MQQSECSCKEVTEILSVSPSHHLTKLHVLSAQHFIKKRLEEKHVCSIVRLGQSCPVDMTVETHSFGDK